MAKYWVMQFENTNFKITIKGNCYARITLSAYTQKRKNKIANTLSVTITKLILKTTAE